MYELIFPTKTFYTTKLSEPYISEAITLKNPKQYKFILVDDNKKRGRLYWGSSFCNQLDFEIKKCPRKRNKTTH